MSLELNDLDGEGAAENVAAAGVDFAAEAKPTGRGDRAVATRRAAAFGSFWIDQTEFALPVEVIQEMVSEPESFASLPLSPPFVLGVFNLRGAIIPVIDLRIWLGFPESDRKGGRKIAIIENDRHCVGLLFDDSSGVINVDGATRVEFQADEAGEKDVAVDGVLKLDDGARLVQILNPTELLSIKQLPRVAKSQKQDEHRNGERLKCISFQLGDTQCALDVRSVQEIMDVPEVSPSPLARGHTLGTIELRGRTLPIVDFHGMMGQAPPKEFGAEDLRSRKLLILSLPDGPIGLIVHAIDSIITYFEADILPLSNVRLPRHDLFAGCLMDGDDARAILLDHEELLKERDLSAAARACQMVHHLDEQRKEEEAGQDASAIALRSTFILFTVQMQLAIDISCVNEIMDRPAELLQPPSEIDYVEGMFNLRGEMITLINPRTLYGLPASESVGRKVLIFQNEDRKYGMVVDSVDEIVTGAGNRFTDVPAVTKNGDNRLVSEDVKGCLWIAAKGPDSAPVMILDVGALVTRCVEAEH